jgi:hypothetical protein
MKYFSRDTLMQLKFDLLSQKAPKVLFFMFLEILQMSFFKLTIKNNDASAMGLPYTMNHMTQLWKSLAFS